MWYQSFDCRLQVIALIDPMMSVIAILRQLTNYLPNGGSGNFGLADKRELIGFVNTCAFIGS